MISSISGTSESAAVSSFVAPSGLSPRRGLSMVPLPFVTIDIKNMTKLFKELVYFIER